MLHRNLPLKAAALLLAIFLWFWVLLNEHNPIVEVPVEVAVTAEDVKAGLALRQSLPSVEVRLRGLKQDTDDIGGEVEAFISCRGMGPERRSLRVQVRAPGNVTVTSIRPPEVLILLEEVIGETRPVELRLVGEVPPGYELLDAEVSPEVVRVSGPRSQVERAGRVVATMDLVQAVHQVPVSRPIYAVDSSGTVVGSVNLSPTRANVTITMNSLVASRTVPVVISTHGAPLAGLRIVSIQVEPAMVTLFGPANRIQEVAQLQTEELVLSDASSSFTRSLLLRVPEGLNLLGDSSVTVTVAIEAGAPVVEPPREEEQQGQTD